MTKGIPRERIKDIRELIADQKKQFLEQQILEQQHYDKREKPWEMHDDSLEDMQMTFRDQDIVHWGFNYFLRNHFKEKMGSLVGIELGGPGSNFFGEIQGFCRSLGITVKDFRQVLQNQQESDRDLQKHHSIIEADIFSRGGLKKADEWLNGEKADFIIERLQGGWGRNVDSFALFAKYLAHWYKRLSSQGVMFLQTPLVSPDFQHTDHSRNYAIWLELLKEKYDGNIRIISSKSKYVLRIQKSPQSPERIETLKF